MRNIADLAETRALVGQEVAVSDWVDISQRRIDDFADATGDRQWIHVDPERCRRESPYGTTVAHGFLTLSLVPAMLQNALCLADVGMALNYGLNKVRFPAPVPVDSRLRARLSILAVHELADGAQIDWGVAIEREGGDKPVCVAQFLMRRYP